MNIKIRIKKNTSKAKQKVSDLIEKLKYQKQNIGIYYR